MLEPERIADQMRGQGISGVDRELQPLFAGERSDDRIDVADDRGQCEGGVFQDQGAGLDLGEVEDVVDHTHQPLCCRLALCHVVTLLVVELRLQAEVRQADDGVQRRADLMAHVGDERALGEGGVLGRLLGLAELRRPSEHPIFQGCLLFEDLPFVALALGRVELDRHEVIQTTGRVEHR